jgi:hypothetical protein
MKTEDNLTVNKVLGNGPLKRKFLRHLAGVKKSRGFSGLKDFFYEQGRAYYDLHQIGKLIHRSLDERDFRWKYNGQMGIFVNDPNQDTQILLCVPKKGECKYIHGSLRNGKKIIAALSSLYGFPNQYHMNIVRNVEEMFEPFREEGYLFGAPSERGIIKDLSGGHLSVKPRVFKSPQISLFGGSERYGSANHEQIMETLKRNGIEAIVSN